MSFPTRTIVDNKNYFQHSQITTSRQYDRQQMICGGRAGVLSPITELGNNCPGGLVWNSATKTFSGDIEPMKGGFGAKYFNMVRDFIKEWR